MRHETFDDNHIGSYGEWKDESCCRSCSQDQQPGCCFVGYGPAKGAEIISADSRQVYRGMDIGTGKDLADYTIHGKQIPYHLIDICEPGTKYNLFEYQQDFYDAYQDIQKRGVLPILMWRYRTLY